MLEDSLVSYLGTVTRLKPFIDGPKLRIFPLIVPQKDAGDSPRIPCLVYTLSSEVSDSTFCASGDFIGSSYQVDCYAASYSTARQLAKAMKTTMLELSADELDGIIISKIFLRNQFDVFDPEPGIFHRVQLYDVWYREVEELVA